MSQFKIKEVNGRVHDTSFGGYPYRIDVLVETSPKYFRSFKGDLGNLVLDVNNAVYSYNENIPSYSPSIDSKIRSVKGVKSLVFSYFFKDHLKAEKLGYKILKLRNGDCLPEFNQWVRIFAK